VEGKHSTQSIREVFTLFSPECKRHLGDRDLGGRITLKWGVTEIPQYGLDYGNSGSGPRCSSCVMF
jgi:hypothetical protein